MARAREARLGPHGTCVGIDVGKSSRWAYAVDADGNEVPGRRLANGAEDVGAPLDEAGAGALAVVDQKNDVGSLVARRCRAKGTARIVQNQPPKGVGRPRNVQNLPPKTLTNL